MQHTSARCLHSEYVQHLTQRQSDSFYLSYQDIKESRYVSQRNERLQTAPQNLSCNNFCFSPLHVDRHLATYK